MSRKIVVAVTMLALLALVALPAFADTASDAKAWFDQKFAAKKAYVDQAVSEGRITAEQGQAMKQHFDQMYQFHQQNGFVCPMGGPGQGMGRGMGPGGGMGKWGVQWSAPQTQQ